MTKRLSPEEEALWKANTKDVKRLSKTKRPPSPSRASPRRTPVKPREANLSALRGTHVPSSSFGKKHFRRTRIDARFDMHGLTLQTAPEALARFLWEAQTRGFKTILVVTGKGAIGATHTLRYHLPQWLQEPPLSQLVCAFHHPAKIQDGGVGAFYVELRKKG